HEVCDEREGTAARGPAESRHGRRPRPDPGTETHPCGPGYRRGPRENRESPGRGSEAQPGTDEGHGSRAEGEPRRAGTRAIVADPADQRAEPVQRRGEGTGSDDPAVDATDPVAEPDHDVVASDDDEQRQREAERVRRRSI